MSLVWDSRPGIGNCSSMSKLSMLHKLQLLHCRDTPLTGALEGIFFSDVGACRSLLAAGWGLWCESSPKHNAFICCIDPCCICSLTQTRNRNAQCKNRHRCSFCPTHNYGDRFVERPPTAIRRCEQFGSTKTPNRVIMREATIQILGQIWQVGWLPY